MKYFIVAGEASGELHGSNLMKSLKDLDIEADFRFLGGDLMLQQGGKLVKHYRDMAFMGVVEVIANLRTIRKNFDDCQTAILDFKPDAVILIDYAGFNLRIARFAKQNGFRVFYYISPKFWAWRQSRVEIIKAFVDRLFVIFPFEVEFYKRCNYDVSYCGNPLLDEIQKFANTKVNFAEFITDNGLQSKPIIALLPGSRKQEIKYLLPEMLKMVAHYPEYQFVIAGANSLNLDFYQQFTANYEVRILFDKTYQILQQAHTAIVTSGTATLETALFGVPQIVLYKTNPITLFIGLFIVKVKYFSLVNIITNKPTVQEIFQENIFERTKAELDLLLYNNDYRNKMLAGYLELKTILGEVGASDRVASQIIGLIKQ